MRIHSRGLAPSQSPLGGQPLSCDSDQFRSEPAHQSIQRGVGCESGRLLFLTDRLFCESGLLFGFFKLVSFGLFLRGVFLHGLRRFIAHNRSAFRLRLIDGGMICYSASLNHDRLLTGSKQQTAFFLRPADLVSYAVMLANTRSGSLSLKNLVYHRR